MQLLRQESCQVYFRVASIGGGKRIDETAVLCTVRVWYVFPYHTRMVVPYAYMLHHGCTQHKASIGTGSSIPKAYTQKQAQKEYLRYN